MESSQSREKVGDWSGGVTSAFWTKLNQYTWCGVVGVAVQYLVLLHLLHALNNSYLLINMAFESPVSIALGAKRSFWKCIGLR
jgi:hypothetical protein